MIRDFFTTAYEVEKQGPAYMVPSDIYDANEIIFFKLVLSTKKRSEIESKFKIRQGLDFADLMDNVFGARPSLSNLSKFFSNSVIQGLWIHGFGEKLMLNPPESTVRVHKGFIRESDLLIDKNNRHILAKLSPVNRSKLVKHCQKIVKDGLDIV